MYTYSDTDSDEDDFDDNQALVIDNGSHTFKIGFGGDDAPRAVFPTLYGKIRYPTIMVGMGENDGFIGDEARSKQGVLTLSRPNFGGVIKSLDHMDSIFHHAFYNEMCIAPEEHPFLILDSPLTPVFYREQLLTCLFETHNIPSLLIYHDSIASLISTGNTIGTVVDIGYAKTTFTPIYDSHLIEHATLRSPVAGSAMNDYFQTLITESGLFLKTTAEQLILDDMRIQVCFTSLDIEASTTEYQTKTIDYTLPDKIVAHLGTQVFKCPELLFDPPMNGFEQKGIHEILNDSIQKCAIDIRKSMYQNIVLVGGVSLTRNLPQRLKQEFIPLISPTAASWVKIHANPERRFSAWVGGSILTTMRDFVSTWISFEEYEEYGPGIIHKRSI